MIKIPETKLIKYNSSLIPSISLAFAFGVYYQPFTIKEVDTTQLLIHYKNL